MEIGIVNRFELCGALSESGDDGFGELLGADSLLAVALFVDISGVDSIFNGFEPSIVDFPGDDALSDVDEHLDGSEEESRGVSDAFSGDVGGGAMDGFEHSAGVTDIGGTSEADGAGDFGGDVGHDVAVEIGDDDDVEEVRPGGDTGHSDVDDVMVGFDARIFGGHFIKDLVKESVGQLHDVVFGHAGDFFASVGFGVFECVANDSPGAGFGNEFEALDDVLGLAVFDSGVEVFFVFADDDDIHSIGSAGECGVVGDAGADVGEEPEGFADRYIEGFESSTLGSGDGGFEEDFGAAEGFPSFFGDSGGISGEVNRFSDLDFFGFDGGFGGMENAQGCGHDFWADTVTVRDGYGGFGS